MRDLYPGIHDGMQHKDAAFAIPTRQNTGQGAQCPDPFGNSGHNAENNHETPGTRCKCRASVSTSRGRRNYDDSTTGQVTVQRV